VIYSTINVPIKPIIDPINVPIKENKLLALDSDILNRLLKVKKTNNKEIINNNITITIPMINRFLYILHTIIKIVLNNYNSPF
ncbi:MAG: hypothetical protein K2P14_00725, partial [Anaeroplasmataceae bacterium]|nr:hypothetical protein [Anaeroplasmataceae bacterium]